MKEIVHLRLKKLAKGMASFYLDWNVDGNRHYEYLNLYVDQIHTDRDTIARNKEIERTAMQLRNKKEDLVIFGATGAVVPKNKKTATIGSFCDRLSDNAYVRILKRFVGENCSDVAMSRLTPRIIEAFYSSISNYALSTQSQVSRTFKSAVRLAVNEDVLPNSMLSNFHTIKVPAMPVTYLTIDELTQIKNTKWHSEVNRRAFLFACLTGLRYSDIQKLVWSEVTKENYLVFSQLKTQIDANGTAIAFTRVPLSRQAIELLGERKEDNMLVFPNMSSNKAFNKQLKVIAKRLGLNKNLHFHLSRHTCGVMLVSHEVDIYTVSKLLGHSDIKTTVRFYSNITDEHAEKSVNKIPEI